MPSVARLRASARALWVVASLVLLLAVFLFAGGVAYRAYLAVPDIPELPARPSPIASPERPLLMFIIDGFTPQHAFDPAVMPTFARLAQAGASGIARTSSITLTAPCVFSLATGRPGTLLLGIFDFHAPESRVESLPRMMRDAGRRVILAGEESWSRQFGWTAQDEDREVAPPTGVTIDERVRRLDDHSSSFLLDRIRTHAYGMAVVHLTSVDAVGHMVTPSAPEYRDALRYVDGLLERTVAAAGDDVVLLVTGDHGMGPRGTHSGRDDEASLTPYVLHGPGVRQGVKRDLPQTALASTLATLAGLPMLYSSQHSPLTDLLVMDERSAGALEAAYLEQKVAATKALAPHVTLDTALRPSDLNDRLNAVLFAADDHAGQRSLAALAATAGVLLALVIAWRSNPWRRERTSLLPNLLVAAAVPCALALAAGVFMSWRSLFPYQSAATAKMLALASLIVAGIVGLFAYRSPGMRERLRQWPLALFFVVIVILSAPLVNSGWFQPEPYFKGLLVAGLCYLAARVGTLHSNSLFAVVPVGLVGVVAYGGGAPSEAWPGWTYLAPLSLATLAVSIRNAWSPDRRGIGAAVLLTATFLFAWIWKLSGGNPSLATVVLICSLVTICASWWIRCDAVGAAALLIGGTAALSLMMAESAHESLVFLLVALGALLLSRRPIAIGTERALYVAAAVAVLLRLCLYFELGDYYSLSSIRTAPGFRIVSAGQPLGTVISLLILKYSLPWLLILGAVLPAVVEAGPQTARHAVHLLALGYVARFALIAAVIDPFRVLPNGMGGIISLFAISWAELVTLALAAVIFLSVTDRVGARVRPA